MALLEERGPSCWDRPPPSPVQLMEGIPTVEFEATAFASVGLTMTVPSVVVGAYN